MRRWHLLLILLAGFMLRLALYDVHGLEGDDAFSLAVSRAPRLIPGLMRLQLDVHPPLHFLLLKAWVAGAGDSLLSLRLLNILLDMLTGALLVHLVRREARPYVLVLWALSPLLIFGGWLVRMYTLLGLLATATAVMTVRRRVLWAAGLFALLAMYTHVLGVIVFAAAGAVLLVRRAWRVIPVFGAAGVLYLPFALNAFALAQSVETLGAEVNPAFDASLPPWQQAGLVVWSAFFHRLSVPAAVLPLALIALIALLVMGFRTKPGLIAALTFAGLLLMVWAIGLKPRYVVPFVPLWLALVVSVVQGRGPRLAVTGFLAALMIASLWQNTRYGWRDDWLAAANFVETYTAPGDAVLVVPDWGQEAMRYHYDGAAPVRGFFPQLNPALDLDAAFGDYVRDRERVWLVRYQPEVSDPDALAPAWLDERGAAITTVFPAGMAVTLYDLQLIDNTLPPSARPLDVQFGDVLALLGDTLPGGVTTSAVNTRLYDESGRVLVALHWEPLRETITQTPRVRLTDTFGQVYGGTLDAPDQPPVSRWPAGAVITAYYDLNLNPATPPGAYNVEVMVLDESGAPLPTTGADAGEYWAVAGQVIVE